MRGAAGHAGLSRSRATTRGAIAGRRLARLRAILGRIDGRRLWSGWNRPLEGPDHPRRPTTSIPSSSREALVRHPRRRDRRRRRPTRQLCRRSCRWPSSSFAPACTRPRDELREFWPQGDPRAAARPCRCRSCRSPVMPLTGVGKIFKPALRLERHAARLRCRGQSRCGPTARQAEVSVRADPAHGTLCGRAHCGRACLDARGAHPALRRAAGRLPDPARGRVRLTKQKARFLEIILSP